ncbi:MAG: cell wall hydrolase [Muribaculaceae bacterium]|nr:cell wall hydrolase [Muribaculaceae bacterium]
MLKGRGIFLMISGLFLSLGMLYGMSIDADASSTKEYLDSLNVGISSIIETGSSDNEEAIRELSEIAEEAARSKSDLVMADVKQALNVRAEATEESDKVGLLYKDCGGRILERKDGWTKLQSGDLVGWASDEYLLFDEDAKEMASEVGNMIVTIETETLRVRQAPDTDSEILGLLSQDDELEVIEVINNEWVSVSFEKDTAYVSAEYVNMDFHIDEGETMEAIKQREEAEAEAKRKAVQNVNEAIMAEGDDLRLLAALIHCEAGAESYDGKLAVGAVVMNRVRSGAYPNTISGVIYASGQFTPAINGKVAKVYYNGNIAESCIQAAQEALAGASNVGGATHFRRAGNHDGIQIDNQVFW